jgi:hypothetical protein
MKNFGTVVREIARAVEIVQICLTQLSEWTIPIFGKSELKLN